MCENGRERAGERGGRVCVNVRETTALGCWRHALALVCVCVCARLCRYVCDSCTQHASVNVCMRVCLFTRTLEGCLARPRMRV